MKRLLIIGSGDVARRCIPLLKGHYRILALVRDSARCEELRALGVVPLIGDLDNRRSLKRLAGLADAVLHFAPPLSAPPLRRGGREGFSDTRTRHLLTALSRGTLPRRLIYISTSGVYGDCGGAEVEEMRPIQPQTARSQRRADAERQIREWAQCNRVNAAILRVPGIYAADRLPLARLRQGTPAIVAEQDGYTNHIHADDLARIIVAALHHAKPCRVYHASDDGEMKMGDYFDAVADACRLPRPPRLSRAEAERTVPPTLWSFMNESRRLSNRRMKRELKVRLCYPTVANLLSTIGHTCA